MKPAMVVTDLDGTLLRSDRTLADRDIETLTLLGEKGVLRVVCTGRSLFAAQMVLRADLPLDYLIFSSGSGVLDWKKKELLFSTGFDENESQSVFSHLKKIGVDFMVHRPVPENHNFQYVLGAPYENPDFQRRLNVYDGYFEELTTFDFAPTQFLIVEPEEQPSHYEPLQTDLPNQTVLKATSPLDGCSRWIEIFPKHVSKSQTTAWLCKHLGVETERVLAIGNDFNDIDLLEWAGTSRVVSNAVPDVAARFDRLTFSNDNCGFTEATDLWCQKFGFWSYR